MNNLVFVISSEDEWESKVDELMRHIGVTNVVGFDCEWVEVKNWHRLYENSEPRKRLTNDCRWMPNNNGTEEAREYIRIQNTKKDRVSLVQIAASDGYTILIRTILFQRIPLSMKALFENPRIFKVGVNIFADCSRLHRDWNVIVNSWLDIRFLVKDVPLNNINEPLRNGLKALGQTFCEDTKSYGQWMRFSNWCDVELSQDQIMYASQDAQIAVETYGNLGLDSINMGKLGEHGLTSRTLMKESSSFWSKWNTVCQIYLNCKFDQDKFMSLKTGGLGANRSRKTRDDIEDSDSDLDMDITHLADVLTFNFEKDLEVFPLESNQDLESGELDEPVGEVKRSLMIQLDRSKSYNVNSFSKKCREKTNGSLNGKSSCFNVQFSRC